MNWNLTEALAYYKTQGAPANQSALTELLREIQREQGGRIPRHILPAVAEAYGIRESFLLAIIRRLPSLKIADVHTLELCAGPNCGKHRLLAACAEELQQSYDFELRYVPCMRLCGKGPNLRWDGKLYHRAEEALLRQLVTAEAGPK